MNHRLHRISAQAKAAADRGELIAAIQLTQDQTGMKLEEAQRAVHEYLRGGRQTDGPSVEGRLSPEALASLQRGNLIEAIKLTRDETGLGLKDAKDLVERHLEQDPHLKQQFDLTQRSRVNIAPVVGAFVVLLLGALVLYWFLVKR